ncbi:thioesterase family protein [Afifella pfennigii]|uniref:thioesterase family protein n=1 Tax=Afifella pfennigii TaxID=209897 RepID=UPI001AEBE44A|nr:thioesterase family protein [Afifella pfennigii]
MHVKDEWIDYNGHMNVAYYVLLFDRAIDEAFLTVGLGPEYVEKRRASFFTVELHVHYLRELTAGAPVFATWQCLGADDKRIRSWLELFHAEEGYLAAACEQMHVHVDLAARRSAAFPPHIRQKLDETLAAHQALPFPERAGAAIGNKKR